MSQKLSLAGNHPLPPGFRLQEYVIERWLSPGGFSMVYLARNKQQRPVIIKEYLPDFAAIRTTNSPVPRVDESRQQAFQQGLACFFEESRILASLNHSNVVKVEDFFRANETAYLVMPFQHGRTLQSRIGKQSVPLQENVLRGLFTSLLNGLRAVHSHRLLHLDFKPANIYLRRDGTPLLLDFGAARQVLGQEEGLRAMRTPGFAAPEQHQAALRTLGPWTDIYALGACLYNCLGNRPPLAADKRLLGATLLPAQEKWRGQYSPALLNLIDRCLALDPLDRPQSVFAVQKILVDTPDRLSSAELAARLRALAQPD